MNATLHKTVGVGACARCRAVAPLFGSRKKGERLCITCRLSCAACGRLLTQCDLHGHRRFCHQPECIKARGAARLRRAA